MLKYLSIIFILAATTTFSQGFKMRYSSSIADCFGAVEVLDYTQESRVQFPGNFGTRDDFINLNPDFHEVNSIWLRLEPRLEGKFEFEIFTENNVDFSYFLFKAPDNTFCEQLEEGTINPILYSMPDYYTKGIENSPRDDNFKPSVETHKHDVFYLLIHTNSTYQGKVRVNYKRIGEVSTTQAVVQDFRKREDDNFIRIKIRDKDTGEPVEANLTIQGVGRDNALFLGTDFIFSAGLSKELHVESNTAGYFIYVRDIETNKDKDTDTEIVLELERLEPGKKLLLEDIKFRQDSDEFLPIAMPALKRLLDFMALNDGVKIEIQGHVNAPGTKNSNRIQKLSEERAKAVKKWLKQNGIDDSRMEAVGLGNTQPLYEKPKHDWQEEANRRVEIMIVA